MAFTLSAPPLQDPMVDKEGLMTRTFYNWFLSLTTRVQSSSAGIYATSLPSETAALPLTTLLLSAASGVYRVSWTVRIVTPASVSSSVQVVVSYLDATLALQQVGAAVTGNTTSTVASGVIVLRSDPASPITVSTNYASVGTAMVYALDVVLEQMA